MRVQQLGFDTKPRTFRRPGTTRGVWLPPVERRITTVLLSLTVTW